MKHYLKYFSALLLFGFNGIVASHISLSSYEIVYLRTLIGSMMLIAIFKLTGGHFHIKENKKDSLFILLSGIAMGQAGCFYTKHISKLEYLSHPSCTIVDRRL